MGGAGVDGYGVPDGLGLIWGVQWEAEDISSLGSGGGIDPVGLGFGVADGGQCVTGGEEAFWSGGQRQGDDLAGVGDEQAGAVRGEDGTFLTGGLPQRPRGGWLGAIEEKHGWAVHPGDLNWSLTG